MASRVREAVFGASGSSSSEPSSGGVPTASTSKQPLPEVAASGLAGDLAQYVASLRHAVEQGGMLDRSGLEAESLSGLVFDSVFQIWLPFLLGISLLLFGIRATKLVHGVCGTLLCLFFATLLFGTQNNISSGSSGSGGTNTSGSRSSGGDNYTNINLCAFSLFVGGGLGVWLLPKYTDVVGGCVGLVLAEVLGQLVGFYTGGTQYVLADLIGFMLGNLASRYVFKEDAVDFFILLLFSRDMV